MSVVTPICRNWKEFFDYVYGTATDNSKYIWRGHRCSNWQLVPTIDRRADLLQPRERSALYAHQLDQFKLAARGRRGPFPSKIDDENEWRALGQHNGLATPLLDWTTSPFVAAFFAFAETGQMQTPDRAIFALHQPTVEQFVQQRQMTEIVRRLKARSEAASKGKELGIIDKARLEATPLPELEFVRPQTDENYRLINQGGLFTKSNTSSPIEAWIDQAELRSEGPPVLIKILIPDTEREVALRMLNRMNINPLSLFPDLTGASLHCNLHLDIKGY